MEKAIIFCFVILGLIDFVNYLLSSGMFATNLPMAYL
jgi:hypothetical protein